MRHVGKAVRFVTVLQLPLALFLPSTTWAQARKGTKKDAAAGAVEIEEITVTAQKREENLQEVPISVTAITGAGLAQRGATSVADLTESVPNLWAQTVQSGASNMVIAMRGTSQQNFVLSQNPTVGLYIDGAYIAKIPGSNFDLDDLARVEVLRGPQGTLYGKNTIGGAVNLITQKPSEERSVTASTEVGNFDAFRGRLTVNVPLIGKHGVLQSDSLGTLSLRENAVYTSHEPYFTNVAPTNAPLPVASGGAGFSNLNRIFNMTALRWQPARDITVDYSFEYHRYREAPAAQQTSYVYPGSGVDGGPFDLRPYVRTNRVDSLGANAIFDQHLISHRFQDDGNNRMHILTGTWDLGELGTLGRVTLKSISAYRSMTSDLGSDVDGSPLHVLDFYVHDNLDHWSEEVQWIGTTPRLHYVLGAYYYGEHTTEESGQVLFGGGLNFFSRNTGKTSSYAPFGQITWTPPILNDNLSVTGGLRFTEEHVQLKRHYQCLSVLSPVNGQLVNLCNQGIPGFEDFNVSVAKGFGTHGTGLPGLTPMGDISYQWTANLMTYFRVSRGFQSGGANGTATDERLFRRMYNPEKLLAYEAGFKSQWFDNRLRVNADGFYSDYTDQVVNVFRASQTSGVATTLENAGKSEIWGSELEVSALPLRGVEATVNYSYLSPKYTEWFSQKFDASGNPVFDQNGNPVLEDVSNQREFPTAPEHTFTVGLTYTAPPTRSGVFSAHIDTYWQDSVVFEPQPPHPERAGSYAVVNGRMQLADIPLQTGSLDLAVFARNLFDRKYRTWGLDVGSLGWASNVYGAPRTFGIGLTYHFTAS